MSHTWQSLQKKCSFLLLKNTSWDLVFQLCVFSKQVHVMSKWPLNVSLLFSTSAALVTMERVSGQQELSPEGMKVSTIFLSLSYGPLSHFLSVIELQSSLFLFPDSPWVCIVFLLLVFSHCWCITDLYHNYVSWCNMVWGGLLKLSYHYLITQNHDPWSELWSSQFWEVLLRISRLEQAYDLSIWTI